MRDAPPSWGGTAATPTTPAGNGKLPEGYDWKRLSDIQVRPIEFVLRPFLQKAAFHLLVGVKNAGKGTWLAHWAACVTRGELGPRQRVIWVAIGEDSYAMDVRPRIEAAGGDPAKVTVLVRGNLLLPEGAEELVRLAAELGDVGMIIVDPVGGALAASKNTNKDDNIRPSLTALNWVADTSGAMVIGVRHLSIKHERHTGGALSAILGSSDWVNIPRAVLALMRDDEDRANRHLFVITGNRVNDDTPGLMWRIEGHTPTGWNEEVTKARVLGESAKDPDELLIIKTVKRTETKTGAARKLIIDTLAVLHGNQMESELLDAEIAKKTGLAARTIRNVRDELREAGLVKSVPEKDENGTVLRWLVTLTAAGMQEGGTGLNPVPQPVPFPGTQLGGGSGDLQGKTQKGVARLPSPSVYLKRVLETDDLDTDFVTPDPDHDIPF